MVKKERGFVSDYIKSHNFKKNEIEKALVINIALFSYFEIL